MSNMCHHTIGRPLGCAAGVSAYLGLHPHTIFCVTLQLEKERKKNFFIGPQIHPQKNVSLTERKNYTIQTKKKAITRFFLLFSVMREIAFLFFFFFNSLSRCRWYGLCVKFSCDFRFFCVCFFCSYNQKRLSSLSYSDFCIFDIFLTFLIFFSFFLIRWGNRRNVRRDYCFFFYYLLL